MIDGVVDEDGGPEPTTPAKRALRLLPLLVVGAILVLVLASGVWRHLSLDELKARRTALTGFVHLHPVESIGLYVAAYFLVVALSIPGALIMTLTGGFLFGTWIGGAAAAAGVSSGAVAMFLVAHTALGGVIRKYAKTGGMIEKVEAGVRRHAFSYLLFLRLMPVAPIWLINIAAAFVRTPLWVYALATLIGIAPSCFIYASIGSSLNRVFAAPGKPNLSAIFHPEVFVALFALAALALLPIAYQAWRRRR